MCFSSKSTSSTFSPARNVLSITRPCRMCLSLVRTKAPPLPGLTCWKSTMLYGCPSNWIFSPFLKSAVDTCIRLWSLSSLSLGAERLFEPGPGPLVVRVLPAQPKEDHGRVVREPLLETERAHARGDERLVGQETSEGGARVRAALRSQGLQHQARLAVGCVELDHMLEMLPRLLPPSGLPVNLRGHPVRLRVPWTGLQNDGELGQGRFRVGVVQMRLGEDQPRRRVVLEARQPLPAQVDRLSRAPHLAVGVGQRGEGQRGWIPHEAFLVSLDGGRRHGIVGEGCPATLGDRVRHALPL